MGTNVQVMRGDATALDLPDDRFTGAASFNMLHHVPTAESQDRIFAELGRVLRAGGVLVAVDSAPRDQLDDFHVGDTYNPIDPGQLGARLERAGFLEVGVRDYDLGWIATALRAEQGRREHGEELALSVLERLEPEARAGDVPARGDGGLSVLHQLGVVVVAWVVVDRVSALGVLRLGRALLHEEHREGRNAATSASFRLHPAQTRRPVERRQPDSS